MATVKELLRAESDGTLSFGDYTLTSKTKLDNFEFEGDLYKVKHLQSYKLEKMECLYTNSSRSCGREFQRDDREVEFEVSAPEDVQFTLELEPDSEYEVFIDEASAGKMTTNLSGKLSVSIELNANESAAVKVVKR